ncbi:MAG: FMN-binding negative transcriptional regulator [Dehalococcoidia bacterium]|nr:FMN-binding negative transcriptional regulator [Dehalococcoidia bacterium]
MYTPPHNRNGDPEELLAFMRRYPFGTVVTGGTGGLVASHLPLNASLQGDRFTVASHMAKANGQWREFGGGEVLAIFTEPHAYISPRHYPPGPWVPTWNYVAVHAHGRARVIDDREGKLAVLRDTIASTEPGFQDQFDTYAEGWVDAKLKGIVAFSIDVNRIEGRWKLSQDRDAATRERISAALERQGGPAADLAAYTRATL